MKMRLDQYLVAQEKVPTRAKARDAIKRGCVRVDGVVAVKAGMPVSPASIVAVAADAAPYVSRGGLKLAAALEYFGFDVCGRTVLDAGASTGGFSDVLLQGGAAKIFAVDVGHGQLVEAIRDNPKVVALEGVDIRSIDTHVVTEAVDAIVADISFMSLVMALPGALGLATDDCWLAVLVKPQFEVGRGLIGKGGIVRDPAAHEKAVDKVWTFIAAQPGWRVLGVCESPITGGGGNKEFIIGAQRGE